MTLITSWAVTGCPLQTWAAPWLLFRPGSLCSLCQPGGQGWKPKKVLTQKTYHEYFQGQAVHPIIAQVQPLQTRRSCWKVIQVVLFLLTKSFLCKGIFLTQWHCCLRHLRQEILCIFAHSTFLIAHLTQQVLKCIDLLMNFGFSRETRLIWFWMKCGISNFRKAIVKFRGMLGGGFMIGKMEGDTISDRWTWQSL